MAAEKAVLHFLEAFLVSQGAFLLRQPAWLMRRPRQLESITSFTMLSVQQSYIQRANWKVRETL